MASTNPVKASAVRGGFVRMFPNQRFSIEKISAESGVSAQPSSDAETLLGACNRARNARDIQPDADYWVGLEGGVEVVGQEIAAFAWVAVLSPDGLGKARTGTFFLPSAVARLVASGIELGEADDIVFGRSNSKQENGAVGLLTDNVLDRAAVYEQAVILALALLRTQPCIRIYDRTRLSVCCFDYLQMIFRATTSPP